MAQAISFLHRVAIKRYFLLRTRCGVIVKNRNNAHTAPEFLMPHSLYATDTDLSAENLLRLPGRIRLPGLGLRRADYPPPDCPIEPVRRGAFCAEGLLQYPYSAPDARAGREGGFGVAGRGRARAGGRVRTPQHPEDIVFTADLILTMQLWRGLKSCRSRSTPAQLIC